MSDMMQRIEEAEAHNPNWKKVTVPLDCLYPPAVYKVVKARLDREAAEGKEK